MAFERDKVQERRIKSALSDKERARFRAKPYENQDRKEMAFGFRRIGQTYSLRPDLVAKLKSRAKKEQLSNSNLVEQILMNELMPDEAVKTARKDK